MLLSVRVSASGPGFAALAYLFAGPAFFLLTATTILPVLTVFALSFTDYELGSVAVRFIGLSHYAQLLQDPYFWRALNNSAIYTAIVVPGSVVLALVLALLVHGRTTTRRFYEIIYFLPVTGTLTAMSIVWSFLLNGRIGPLAQLMASVGLTPIDFFANADYALFGLAIIGIWHLVGFNLVLFLAGLATVSKELQEASRLDGVDGFFDRLRYVVWPLLSPTTIVVVVLSSIQAFQVFDTVAVLTRGGPNGATDLLLYKVYSETFEALKIGYGSALTVVFLALLAAFSIVQAFLLDKRAHYR